LLIGTGFGLGYSKHRDADGAAFFRALWAWTGQTQHITCNAPHVTARLHTGAAGTYLWVSNPHFTAMAVELGFSRAWGPFTGAETVWGEEQIAVDGRTMRLNVPARDLVVARLH